MAPGAVAYAHLGYADREAVTGGSDLPQKGLLAVALLAALTLLPSLVRRWKPPLTVSPDELRELLSRLDPPLILDVRNRDEYAGELGHIERSLLIPVADLEARLGDLASDRRRLLVPEKRGPWLLPAKNGVSSPVRTFLPSSSDMKR